MTLWPGPKRVILSMYYFSLTSVVTRSEPKIPAAGYSEEERFFALKYFSFGLSALKMGLEVQNEHNKQWILEHLPSYGTLSKHQNFGTLSEQPNFVGFLACWP